MHLHLFTQCFLSGKLVLSHSRLTTILNRKILAENLSSKILAHKSMGPKFYSGLKTMQPKNFTSRGGVEECHFWPAAGCVTKTVILMTRLIYVTVTQGFWSYMGWFVPGCYSKFLKVFWLLNRFERWVRSCCNAIWAY